LTEQDLRRDAVIRVEKGTRKRWVRENRQAEAFREPAYRVRSDRQRADQESAAPDAFSQLHTLLQLRGPARHVRKIQAVSARPGVGQGDRFLATEEPLLERGTRLIAQAVIVLDQIDSAQREVVSPPGQLACRQPHRLQRRTEQGAPLGHPAQSTQPLHAVTRPGEPPEQTLRPVDLRDPDSLLERDVAEEQIQQLGDLVTDRLRIVRDDGAPARRAHPVDRIHAADHEPFDLVAERALRKLDRLLQRDLSGPFRGVRLFAAGQVVGHA
jgi:hypothetical protein